VVSILKGLVEDGEMALSDGRRIVTSLPTNLSSDSPFAKSLIVVHPQFRVIVLANRPGQ